MNVIMSSFQTHIAVGDHFKAKDSSRDFMVNKILNQQFDCGTKK